MAIHKFSIRQTFEVTQYITDQFDTNDQAKWNSVKAKAKSTMRPKDFKALPDVPPEDIEVWYKVYRYIETSELSVVDEERGDYTREYIVCDEEDNILIED
jgi:hypothetical protein